MAILLAPRFPTLQTIPCLIEHSKRTLILCSLPYLTPYISLPISHLLSTIKAPTWTGMVQGQQNLFDATRGQLTFESKDKLYKVSELLDCPSSYSFPPSQHTLCKHTVTHSFNTPSLPFNTFYRALS